MPQPSHGALYRHIAATDCALHLALATVAVLLPAALWIGSGQPRPSISDYRRADGWMRDPFISALLAIGLFPGPSPSLLA